jgi:DNA-binding NtrC family response regulator
MAVVVPIVAVAVVATSFITASDASKEAFKTATLLKTLSVNALITGEVGVAKKSLASYILPNAPVLDASKFEELLVLLESTLQIIITNLEKSPNIKRTFDLIKEKKIRVIATATDSFYHKDIDDFFSIKFRVPPLKDRLEDVALLVEQFKSEAFLLFGDDKKINIEKFIPNLSQNASSLRRQVMINYLLQDIKDNELMDIIQNYVSSKLGTNSDYKNLLYLYEVPLIKAGLIKFKSQLKLSDKLGLNRNTLRKKIADNQQYL